MLVGHIILYYLMLVLKSEGIKRKLAKNTHELKFYIKINDKLQLLKLKPGYAIEPSVAQIISNNFKTKDLCIRNGSTSVIWRGEVNLSYLKAPLCDLVELGKTHIEVYPNEQIKPMQGRELNRTCFVTFGKLNKISRAKLNQVCESNSCEIISINQSNCQFTVQIPHFTIYKFEAAFSESDSDSDSDSDNNNKQQKSIPSKKYQKDQQPKDQQPKDDMKLGQESTLSPLRNEEKRSEMRNMVLPTKNLLKEIKKHNNNCQNIIKNERLSGSSSAIGGNCMVSTQIMSPNQHFLILKQRNSITNPNLNIVMKLLKNQQSLTQIILDNKISKATRRILSLYAICYCIQKCKFRFKKVGETLQIVKYDRSIADYQTKQYLKSWLQWVLQSEHSINSHQNQLIRGLGLRKTSMLAERYSNQNITNFQFLSSIEDELYRQGSIPKNLSPQIRNLACGSINDFTNLSWIVQFAVCFWYCCFTDEGEEKLKNILISTELSNDQDYTLQYHILSLYLELPIQNKNLGRAQQKEYPLWYFFSNKNQSKELKLTNERIYCSYRWSLLQAITSTSMNCEDIVFLMQNQKFVNEQRKVKLVNYILRKRGLQKSFQKWGKYSDSVENSEGYLHYSTSNNIKSLEHFSNCRERNSHVCSTIEKTINKKEELISGFNSYQIKKNKQMVKKLINNSNISSKISNLDLIIGIFNAQLENNELILTKQSLNKLLLQCIYINNRQVKQRVLSKIFQQIKKCPHIMSDFKNQVIYGQNKKNIKDQLTSCFIDDAYLLEFSLAKLELF